MRSSYRYVVGGVLLLIQFILGLNWMVVTPLFPIIMDELTVDRATVSLLFTTVPIAQAFFTIPAGIIAARFGAKRIFGVGVWAMAGGLLVLLRSDFSSLVVARVLFGIGTGLAAPLSGAVTVQWFRGRELPVMNGLVAVAASLGVSMGLFVTVPLSGLLGWRGVLGLFGGVAGLAALAWLIFGREGEARAHEVGGSPGASSALSVLKQPSTYWLALAFAGPICYYDVLIAWLPTYYHQVFNMSLASAAALTGILGVMGIPGSLLGSLLSARVGLRRPFLLWPGLLMTPVSLAVFLVDWTWLIIPALALYGLLTWSFTPIVFTIPMELPGFSPPQVAVVIGMILTVTGVAAFGGPLAAGFLTDVTGSYLPGFFLFMVAALTLVVSALKLPETGPRGQRSGALQKNGGD